MNDFDKAAVIARAINKPLKEVIQTVRGADAAAVDHLVERCRVLGTDTPKGGVVTDLLRRAVFSAPPKPAKRPGTEGVMTSLLRANARAKRSIL